MNIRVAVMVLFGICSGYLIGSFVGYVIRLTIVNAIAIFILSGAAGLTVADRTKRWWWRDGFRELT